MSLFFAYNRMVIDMKIAICGANGKMGKSIVGAFHDKHELSLVTRDLPLTCVIEDVDVVVDFTCANVSFQHAILALRHNKPIIIGTTGLSKTMLQLLEDQANERQVGCLYAPNFAYGAIWINSAIKELALHYDGVEIKETHHVSKLGSPSGTALRMKASLLSVNPDLTIHISSERQYSRHVIHQLTFYKEGESITLKHVVSSRNAYFQALDIAINRISSVKGWQDYDISFFCDKPLTKPVIVDSNESIDVNM